MPKRSSAVALVLTTALAAGAALGPSAAGGATKRRCADRPGVTVLVTPDLRVFARTSAEPDPRFRTTTVLSCRPASRAKPTRLTTISGGTRTIATLVGVDPAGPGRVWIEEHREIAGEGTGILRLHDTGTGAALATYGPELSTGPLDKAVADDGALVVERYGSVVAFDGAGARRLNHGEFPVTDIALRGQRVYWSVEGAPRSAVLKGAPAGQFKLP